MRTIASTVRTMEEAELATRRLEDSGIAPDRIQLKEVSEPEPGIFISVKVSPEQANVATDILKGSRRPAEPAPGPNGTESVRVAPRPAHATTTSVGSAGARSERPAEGSGPPTPQVSTRRPKDGPAVGRLIFMALALAAFGLALGGILGTFI